MISRLPKGAQEYLAPDLLVNDLTTSFHIVINVQSFYCRAMILLQHGAKNLSDSSVQPPLRALQPNPQAASCQLRFVMGGSVHEGEGCVLPA